MNQRPPRGARRNLARRLKVETKGGRHRRLDINEWLGQPNSFCSRGEAYALLRQWHYEIERKRFLQNPFKVIPWALYMIVTAPFRWLWKKVIKPWMEKRGEVE
jgi:hypothetical protein